jgi:RHS repeat-associated protein
MPIHSSKTVLLATDQQRSVLNALDANRPHPIAYSPYGHRPAKNGLLSLLGFNGERPDPLTGHYHLGNGYRLFNTVLMRFNKPDSSSPFEEGGVNAYSYCEGNPIGRCDPTGHSFLSMIRKMVTFVTPAHPAATLKLTASTAAAVVGAAGFMVEADDETANTALLIGSGLLLGAGLGGMYRFRPSRTPRLASTPNTVTRGDFEMGPLRSSPADPPTIQQFIPRARIPGIGSPTNAANLNIRTT